ncbi:alpha-galactosidase [Streptomyces sp. NBC_00887]|uniref:alpha-galactosidase n=1 Tax=Streptomyces sp. NBC_00887 TaxID=2975859 RepID=UPI0038634C76|nr:alpha-galactosidase [Streptomyces sp. NBC_00887]WSY36853.1 alpha-galactosidase [Streptomyces sp. NBC_00887]
MGPQPRSTGSGPCQERRNTRPDAGYRLIDGLRSRHPALEIESCSSGGARIDHGILERTDRVWVSDTNDRLGRQVIQRWTGLLAPPEPVGCHIGAATDHTTGRTTTLAFRLAMGPHRLYRHRTRSTDHVSQPAQPAQDHGARRTDPTRRSSRPERLAARRRLRRLTPRLVQSYAATEPFSTSRLGWRSAHVASGACLPRWTTR